MKNPYQLARSLGWFSVALGLTEVLFGRSLARWMGSPQSADLLRGYGLRELTAGAGILQQEQPDSGWLWFRVAGDAMDLVTLGLTYEQPGADRENVGIAIAAVVGATALDIYCAVALDQEEKSLLASATNGEAI